MKDESVSPVGKRLIAGAIAVGTVLGAAGVASAVTSPDSKSDAAPQTTQAVPTDDAESTEVADQASENDENEADEKANGHRGHDETALAAGAQPGTVTMVEQQGTGFEAHVTDVDGAEAEVHFDAALAVVEIGPGH